MNLVVDDSFPTFWVLIKPFLGGRDLLEKGESWIHSVSRTIHLEREAEEQTAQASSCLSVCLADPKEPSGSPSAASEYIAVTDT